MCLILHGTAKKLLRLDLEKAQDFNPHGWGYGIDLNTVYSFNTKSTLRQSLELECPKSVVTLHFRWTTHGETNLENAHPFYIGHDRFLYHNGVASDYCVVGSPYSDTNNLAAELFDKPWTLVCKTLEGISNSRFIVTSPKGFKTFHHWYAGHGVIASNNQLFSIANRKKEKQKSWHTFNYHGYAL